MTAETITPPLQPGHPAPVAHPVRGSVDELVRRRVAERDAALSQLLLSALVDHVQPQELGVLAQVLRSGLRPFLATPRPAPALPKPLTGRELAVLVGMSLGRSNRAIGHSMFVTENTVKTTCRRLFAKLQVADRAHAVARGYELGLLGGTS